MLRFLDPELERAYRDADQDPGVRRARTASLLAIPVWVLVALIGPRAIGVEPGQAWLIAGSMMALLLMCAIVSRWATNQWRRSLIGLGQQAAATVAAITLTVVTHTFKAYAMRAVMLTAVFGFAMTRPPVPGSIALGLFYCRAFFLGG